MSTNLEAIVTDHFTPLLGDLWGLWFRDRTTYLATNPVGPRSFFLSHFWKHLAFCKSVFLTCVYFYLNFFQCLPFGKTVGCVSLGESAIF